MDYSELIRYRQSIRRFTQEQISQSDLSAILEAALSAPVGSNMNQDIHLTVVQNRDVLDKLAQAGIKRWEDKETMAKIVGEEVANMPVRDPFSDAPTVIFVSHRKQDVQPGIEYSNVACIVYAMHLAATDLRLGSVLIWGALEAMREIPELDNTDVLELPNNFEPLLGIAVGYPQQTPKPRDIKTDKFTINYLMETDGDGTILSQKS